MKNKILDNVTSSDIKATYILFGFFIVLVVAGEYVEMPHASIGKQESIAFKERQAINSLPQIPPSSYLAEINEADIVNEGVTYSDITNNINSTNKLPVVQAEILPSIETVKHIKTPEKVRALYITKWYASVTRLRNRVVKKIDKSPVLNAIIIDIKDDTGRISFDIPVTTKRENGGSGASERVIRDIIPFIKELHDKNIYVIGRVSVFQDKYYPKIFPADAIKNTEGGVWGDRKNQHWVDQTAEDYWEYIAAIGKQSYDIGFDEINFDYIRFPTDGKMDAMVYPHYKKTTPKDEVIKEFYAYLHDYFKPKNIPISGDLFGLTTEAVDDMGIGQKFEYALDSFDYVGPMIYPSHYPTGYRGIKDPAKSPYKVIRNATEGAIIKANFDPERIKKIRPWIQDFNLGGHYGVKEIHDQIRAMAELGVYSYMVWDPKNKYTDGAYDEEVSYVLRDFKKPTPKPKKEVAKIITNTKKVSENNLNEIISKTKVQVTQPAQ